MDTKIIICDLDNCVSDDSWRERCLPYNFAKNENEADFDAYNANAKFDRPCNLWIFEQFKPTDFDYAFFTSRPEKFYQSTLAWIKVHLGFSPTWLFMRPKHFNLKEAKLKKMWALQFAEVFGKDKIERLFDDNPKVCDCYVEIFGVEKVKNVFYKYFRETSEPAAPPPILLEKDAGADDDCPF